MKLFFLILAALSLVLVIVLNVIMWYGFNHDIGNWLKLAGDAPSIERADQFLGIALSNMERKGMTRGNSAYIFHNLNADLSIWHSQIQGAKQTTASILARTAEDPASVTQLEKDNALMKIREVLLDDSESGPKVTTPPHITTFPFQWLIMVMYIISIAFNIVTWLIFVFKRW